MAEERLGQVLVAGTQSVTTSPAALNSGASQICFEVLIQADPDNSADVLVGSAAAQTFQLRLGDVLRVRISDVNLVYVKSAAGTQTVNWVAVR